MFKQTKFGEIQLSLFREKLLSAKSQDGGHPTGPKVVGDVISSGCIDFEKGGVSTKFRGSSSRNRETETKQNNTYLSK